MLIGMGILIYIYRLVQHVRSGHRWLNGMAILILISTCPSFLLWILLAHWDGDTNINIDSGHRWPHKPTLICSVGCGPVCVTCEPDTRGSVLVGTGAPDERFYQTGPLMFAQTAAELWLLRARCGPDAGRMRAGCGLDGTWTRLLAVLT